MAEIDVHLVAKTLKLLEPTPMSAYRLVCDFTGKQPISLASLSNIEYLAEQVDAKYYVMLIVLAYEIVAGDADGYVELSDTVAKFHYMDAKILKFILSDWKCQIIPNIPFKSYWPCSMYLKGRLNSLARTSVNLDAEFTAYLSKLSEWEVAEVNPGYIFNKSEFGG